MPAALCVERQKKIKDDLITSSAADLIDASDVLIDFTTAGAVSEFARLAAAKGKAFMCGTTGLSAETHKTLKQAAAKIPVLYASNTSVSLTALKQVAELTAKLLANFDYDIAIIDEHHRMKKDAPSGTAKTLGEAVLRGNGGKKKPEYAAIRAGSIVGEHEVIFAGQGEVIPPASQRHRPAHLRARRGSGRTLVARQETGPLWYGRCVGDHG